MAKHTQISYTYVRIRFDDMVCKFVNILNKKGKTK